MRKLLFLLIGLVVLAGCSSTTSKTLDTTQFQELTQQPGVVTLDVRTPQEFASGHLPNAVNIDVESPTFTQQVAKLDPEVEYAVYCRSGNRSITAMEIMGDEGVQKTADLDGGIVAWEAAGLPVVQ